MRSRFIVLAMLLAPALGVAHPAPARADDAVPIDQGWSTQQKVEWYTLTQGSRLLPLAWFRALEQPGSTRLFLERDHIESFRYLPHASAGAGRLPVGFTIDTQDDSDLGITQLRWKERQSSREAWMGLNCSACHTSEITYKGKRMRIEGGATLADAQRFIDDLNRALVETRDDAAKQDRFAKIVLKGADHTSPNRDMLKRELERYVAWQQQLEKANATPLRYGFARLDAFGFIFNKVLALTEASDQHVNPSDAPVSYPFLWNIHQFDKVQWNGIADSKLIGPTYDIGALGRNVGEVIGVFADVKLRRVALDGFTSSANIHNLDRLEHLLAQLKPPTWPQAVLGKIDPARQAAGQALFATRCASCHAPLARDDLKSRITVTMTPLKGTDPAGTDVWMACNAYTYQGKTGLLRFAPQKFFPVPPIKVFGETAPVAQLLGATAAGVIWNNREDVIGDALGTVRTDIARTKGGPLAKAKGVAQYVKGRIGGKLQKDIAEKIQDISYFDLEPSPEQLGQPPAEVQLPAAMQPVRGDDKAARFKRCMTDDNPLLAYKGRPLTGIWATPPYLHNGSVPTLYDLLLPPEQRPQTFYLGSREFDPDKVGYVTAQSADNTFLYRTRDEAGRFIDGNSNAGHDYGNASLSEEQRRALVEYMKSL